MTAPAQSGPLGSREQYGLMFAFYGVMTGLGLWWMIRRDDDLSVALTASEGMRLLAIEAGVGVGILVVALVRSVSDRLAWARRLEVEIVAMLGPLTPAKVITVAALSGLGEEVLFRGAMQPSLGLLGTSVVFGLAHSGWSRDLFGWAVFATVVGFAFGVLAIWTGGLIAPILAHAVVNGVQLQVLAMETGPIGLMGEVKSDKSRGGFAADRNHANPPSRDL